MSGYDNMTLEEVIYDYAVTRGDLVEQYARKQLEDIIRRKVLAARVGTLRAAADDRLSACEENPDYAGSSETRIAEWLRARADRIEKGL